MRYSDDSSDERENGDTEAESDSSLDQPFEATSEGEESETPSSEEESGNDKRIFWLWLWSSNLAQLVLQINLYTGDSKLIPNRQHRQ